MFVTTGIEKPKKYRNFGKRTEKKPGLELSLRELKMMYTQLVLST